MFAFSLTGHSDQVNKPIVNPLKLTSVHRTFLNVSIGANITTCKEKLIIFDYNQFHFDAPLLVIVRSSVKKNSQANQKIFLSNRVNSRIIINCTKEQYKQIFKLRVLMT